MILLLFVRQKLTKKDKVRTIYEIELIEQDDEIIFRFVGNGFLYNMVRIIVGTLLSVGQGKLDPDSIPEILAKQNRQFVWKDGSRSWALLVGGKL